MQPTVTRFNSNRVQRCKERTFIIDPVTREDYPEQFKNTVSEVVDFASAIFSKTKHNLTCSFLESHNCVVHHIKHKLFLNIDHS